MTEIDDSPITTITPTQSIISVVDVFCAPEVEGYTDEERTVVLAKLYAVLTVLHYDTATKL